MHPPDAAIITEQIAYYRARAAEYDQWFFREGRYFRGEEHRHKWLAEIREVEESLATAPLTGDILELACGTGLWTRHLTRHADRLLAVDASPEAIAINRERVRSSKAEYLVADLFDWEPPRQFDSAFFGFWLSHVPTDRFDEFWHRLGRAIKPGGKVFFVDSSLTQESTATDHAPVDRSGVVERKLADGTSYRIVKHFYEPRELKARLNNLGWQGKLRSTREFFIYGCVHHG